VLAVSTRPDAPRRPLVCLDELPEPWLADTRARLPPGPGHAQRVDDEDERRGTATLCRPCAPLAGRRWVTVTDRRTAIEWAQQIRFLGEGLSPDAECSVLVQDTLNTHTPSSLAEAFPPPEAKRLADKLEWHATPQHGSWLNIAELELRVLSRQCLDRRIPDKATLQTEVNAWATRPNRAGGKVDWQFTTDDARLKLKRLYPSIHE
jgi:hypothetical protein